MNLKLIFIFLASHSDKREATKQEAVKQSKINNS